ncbi:hypothetical protein [Comamonas jiangduensis]|jgi:hypothetical protein|uniref:Uncharacterized protein n=1 Tax=Comamonas jiangduensis TaxID=1194168 RepID=A0ABV4IIK1_9BURK
MLKKIFALLFLISNAHSFEANIKIFSETSKNTNKIYIQSNLPTGTILDVILNDPEDYGGNGNFQQKKVIVDSTGYAPLTPFRAYQNKIPEGIYFISIVASWNQDQPIEVNDVFGYFGSNLTGSLVMKSGPIKSIHYKEFLIVSKESIIFKKSLPLKTVTSKEILDGYFSGKQINQESFNISGILTDLIRNKYGDLFAVVVEPNTNELFLLSGDYNFEKQLTSVIIGYDFMFTCKLQGVGKPAISLRECRFNRSEK